MLAVAQGDADLAEGIAIGQVDGRIEQLHDIVGIERTVSDSGKLSVPHDRLAHGHVGIEIGAIVANSRYLVLQAGSGGLKNRSIGNVRADRGLTAFVSGGIGGNNPTLGIGNVQFEKAG